MNISLLPERLQCIRSKEQEHSCQDSDRFVHLYLTGCVHQCAKSLMVSALMTQNRMVNEIGPPRIHPTNTATKTTPVIVRCRKLFSWYLCYPSTEAVSK